MEMDARKINSAIENRILSIDALRGFTMFWIISGGYIFLAMPDMFHVQFLIVQGRFHVTANKNY